ncbi:MAG: superfamily protein [Verrucomicrobiaceae bacterium]|nr:superfamily protein [Verrucomicrobiaceae bacterium]
MMNKSSWLQSVYLQGVYPYDLRMLLWFMHTRHRRWWIAAARAVSRSGDGLMQVVLPGLLWLLDREHGAFLFVATALAFAIERPLYWVLKNSCQRKRPPEAIPSFHSVITASDRFSFPSGHTCGAFLLAAITSEYHAVLMLPMYLWASAVGVSRVVLGVHFPTDILAGALIGSGIAWFINSSQLVSPLASLL